MWQQPLSLLHDRIARTDGTAKRTTGHERVGPGDDSLVRLRFLQCCSCFVRCECHRLADVASVEVDAGDDVRRRGRHFTGDHKPAQRSLPAQASGLDT